jgi:hypothetical protein
MPEFKTALIETDPFSGLGADVGEDDTGWRPLATSSKTRFDLPPITFERMCKIAQYLYVSNPLAHRIVDLFVSFSVGGGILFKSNNESVDKILHEFWDDPINAWDRKLPVRIRELSLYGEQIYPVAINEQDGRVRMSYLNPLDVTRVIVDPRNVETAQRMEIKSDLVFPNTTPVIDIINPDTNPESPSFGYLIGQTFFFTINKPADATRGVSDLLPLSDSISMYDTFLFNALERSAHMNAWLWDVELKGRSEPEIKQWLKDMMQNPPRPGAVRAHNENVTWNAVAPSLASTDVSDISRLFKLHILGGVGFPEHFFAEAGSAGRAIGENMMDPVSKTFSTRQSIVKSMILYIFNFVIDQAKLHGRIPRDTKYTVAITLPEVTLRDFQRTTAAMYRGAQALQIAVQSGWITKEDASNFFKSIVQQISM